MSELQYVIAMVGTSSALALWTIAYSLHQIRDELRKLNDRPQRKSSVAIVEVPQQQRWTR